MSVSIGAARPLIVLCALALGGCEFFMSPEARIERAQAAIESGDMGAAVVDLKNVLQDDQSNMKARLLLARAQLAQGDVGAARADFEKVQAGEVPPELYEPLRWQIALAQRDYDAVLTGLAKDVPGLAPVARLTLLARAQLAQQQVALARASLDAAVAADPERDEARALLGLAIAAGGDAAAGLRSLEAAAKELPQSAAIPRAIGDLHLQAGNLPAAETAYRTAFERANPKGELAAYLGAAAGFGDALLGQNKLDDAAKLVESLGKTAPGAGVTILLRGRVAAAQRDFPKALEDLQRLVNADPENPQFRTLVAAVNLEQGSLEQATMNLQRAIASNPDYSPARRLLAQVQMAQGRPADAAQTLREAGGERPTPDLVLMQARAALAAGNAAEATRLLERLESEGVSTESVRLDLAAAFLQAGRPERALKLLGEAPGDAGVQRERLRLVALAAKDRPAAIRGLREYGEKNAGQVESVIFAGQTLAALGETAPALELLQKLAAANPKSAEPLLSLARVQARAGQLEAAENSLKRAQQLAPSSATQVGLAQLASARGNEAEAVRWLEQARAADPKATEPRALLARYYVSQRQFDAAQKVADELVQLTAQRPEARILSAGIALERKDAERALADVNEAVRLAPDSAPAWLAKGEVHERSQQLEDARAAYRRALTLAPRSPLPPAALARLELGAKNPDAALDAARRAQQNPETRAAGFRIEAEVLAQLQRFPEAARALEQMQQAQPTAEGAVALYQARVRANAGAPERTLADWIQSNPRDLAVRAAYAEHFQRAGNRARAIQEYEAALKIERNAAVLLNNLAWLYNEVGDKRAVATARRAHELAPRNPAITDTLGWALVNAGQLDEGIRFLREAAAAAPGSVDIQYHLAQALSRKGDKAAAQEVVSRALQAQVTPEWRTRFEELGRTLR
ncbi:MAG: PEP-CTERM system TPR-repeat protein PrsT [Steroidobacteraceae bacterium]|nr:PEP-CTERM system TPR-repeat protein PrsT [Steroidobacteraceae bacterium]